MPVLAIIVMEAAHLLTIHHAQITDIERGDLEDVIRRATVDREVPTNALTWMTTLQRRVCRCSVKSAVLEDANLTGRHRQAC